MNRIPPLRLSVLVAIAGAAGTLAIALVHFGSAEMGHMAVMLPAAIAITAIATAVVGPWLARASFRLRLVSIATFATVIGLANLVVLSSLMLVDGDAAVMFAALMIYSTAAAIGAALAIARNSTEAVDRLAGTARHLAAGDLTARTGPISAAAELGALATTLDEMAARLQSSLERERDGEALRRNLVTAVSHDLRTPLSGLRAMVEAIDDEVVEDPGTIRRYVSEMRTSVESLVGLVDDLFELVQLDAGAIQAETDRARVEEVVGSAVTACEAQALTKGLVLQTRLNGVADVRCSPRLTRVVQNLLQNSIRHTPSDGTIVVEATRRERELELAVTDTGDGIDPSALDLVFEPFWRGDSARTSDGSGLGLALAKRIVDALGGSIAVESEQRRGSRFAVLVPDGGPERSLVP